LLGGRLLLGSFRSSLRGRRGSPSGSSLRLRYAFVNEGQNEQQGDEGQRAHAHFSFMMTVFHSGYLNENGLSALECPWFSKFKELRIMSLKERIVSDMTASMKAKDAARTSTLRMVKAFVMNREIEKGGALTEEEMTKTLQSLVKQRRDSIEQYEKAGRQDLADKERTEIAVIEGYLPQSASIEEIEQAVSAAIEETKATSMREMGQVMKAVQARLAGRTADNRAVSEIVKAKLGQ
jgi:uncharacterized protein YqeY